MFTKSARFYDAFYVWKDYPEEVARLKARIEKHFGRAPASLLDVCCGTGMHASLLSDYTQIVGVDLDSELLEIARTRAPTASFRQCDMLDFDLGQTFEVVTCLFGSVAYTETVDRLTQAIHTMARHVSPGGLLLVEPFFAPENWVKGSPHALFVDEPDLKLARMNVAERDGDVAVMEFHYLVSTPGDVSYFTEVHRLGLFTDQQYRGALAAAGMSIDRDEEGLMGRGLYVAWTARAQTATPS
jgi:ubiquinone/menaquinone biosynthesis C-methylase UbiE